MRVKYYDGQPCDHKGCLHHISHPCEGCGRIGGKGVVYYDELDNMIFILSKEDKPIKIIYEELLCPIVSNYGGDFRCKYAKSKTEEMSLVLYCEEDCEFKMMPPRELISLTMNEM